MTEVGWGPEGISSLGKGFRGAEAPDFNSVRENMSQTPKSYMTLIGSTTAAVP